MDDQRAAFRLVGTSRFLNRYLSLRGATSDVTAAVVGFAAGPGAGSPAVMHAQLDSRNASVIGVGAIGRQMALRLA
jgi:hypothetical protein